MSLTSLTGLAERVASKTSSRHNKRESMPVEQSRFGVTHDNSDVDLFTLRNTAGIEVRAASFGAILVAIRTPNQKGQSGDIVLGYDTLQPYLNQTSYFGAVVGRYANRIAHGLIVVDGTSHQLTMNDGGHHLHGGFRGFDKRLWTAAVVAGPNPGVEFSRVSPDGEEGYPGSLAVSVRYTLSSHELWIHSTATTTAPTVVNLAQHSYFNLSDDIGPAGILDHTLRIDADAYIPVDEDLIPLGNVGPVFGTPFDFTVPKAIGAEIDVENEQLRNGGGYDHNWVLRFSTGELRFAARLESPESRRWLEVFTTEPGLQMYSGNVLDGSVVGKRGVRYDRRAGVCLETQHFPDSPNQKGFPSVVLRPGNTYRSITMFRFGITEMP